MNKSPFYVVSDFISPSLADQIISNVQFPIPDLYADGKPKASVVFDEEYDDIITERLSKLLPALQSYYDFEHTEIFPISIEQLIQDAHVAVHSDGFELIENNWVKTKPWDFTAILFLTDHVAQPPIDDMFECHGGKLEFFNFNFGFNPSVGTLVIFPNDPRFSNATSHVKLGELYQIRIHIGSKTMYLYDPSKFPGTYRTWFS